MSGTILLDTCAVIWIANDDEIDSAATAALDRAAEQGELVYVSPMTAWEVGMLASRGRIAAPMSPQAMFRRILATPGLRLCDLSPELLIGSSFLPGEPPRDPVDRIIIATARESGLSVMTRDRAILAYSQAGHVQAIAC